MINKGDAVAGSASRRYIAGPSAGDSVPSEIPDRTAPGYPAGQPPVGRFALRGAQG
jgi:hypothetical protein